MITLLGESKGISSLITYIGTAGQKLNTYNKKVIQKRKHLSVNIDESTEIVYNRIQNVYCISISTMKGKAWIEWNIRREPR